MIDNVGMISVIHDLGLEVRNFTKARDGKKFSFSCLVCGDSQTDQRKARFGIANKDGSWVCHCFNCGYSNAFPAYLRDFHPQLYERYNVSNFIEKAPSIYDLNPLFEKLSEKKLINIFYVKKFKEPSIWVNYIKSKKIDIEEKNFRKLSIMHKKYWREK